MLVNSSSFGEPSLYDSPSHHLHWRLVIIGQFDFGRFALQQEGGKCSKHRTRRRNHGALTASLLATTDLAPLTRGG